MLVRDRLLQRLAQRWEVRVLAVSAPAGYGKTTLLTQAATCDPAAKPGTDHLLSCGPQHSVASTLGEALCETLSVPARPNPNAAADHLAEVVVAAIWQQSPRQVALLIDDVQEIPEGSDAARLLELVVRRMPSNGHLVLAGRRWPRLRLARLELDCQVIVLDAAELAFTEPELAEFAALRGVGRQYLDMCAGWPAMAELYARARPSVAKEYIAEEVLSGLSQERCQDLALLAHLGTFDEELAHTALGHDLDLAGLLANVPLVSASTPGEWCVHALWRTLLAEVVAAPQIAQAKQRAASTMLSRGRASAAMDMLIAAEAWDDLTGAIVQALGAAHPPVARDVLEQWLTRMPHRARSGPGGQLLAAVLQAESDVTESWRRLEDCAARFKDLGDTAGELASLVQLGLLAWWSEQSEALAMVARRVFELEAAGVDSAMPLACLGRALLFDLAGDWRMALSELRCIPPGSLNDTWQGLVSWAEAILLMALGVASEAESVAAKALTHADAFYAPLAEVTRLQAMWYQGKHAEVLEAALGLAEQIKDSGYANQSAFAAAQVSFVHAMHGQHGPAVDYLALAKAAAAGVNDAPLVATVLAIAEATSALAANDETAALEALAAHVEQHPIGEGLPLAAQLRHLALFYVLLPETRAAFEAMELGPAFRLGRELARSLAAVRAGQSLPQATPPLDQCDLVQAHLPPGWMAELGVAAIAAGRRDGWDLLEQTWSYTRERTKMLTEDPRRVRREAARSAVSRLAVPPDHHLELRLLGRVELLAEGLPVQAPDWRRERVRALLAYLVVNRGVSRELVAADLWPALDTAAQSRNLRVTLTYLLRVLEPQRGQREASFFIRQNRSQLSLHPGDWLTTDLWQFDKLWQQACEADRRGAPESCVEHALAAVELWRGEPPGLLSDHWAVAPFEQRRARYAALSTRAGELLLARGDSERAGALADQALAVEPWHDKAHRLAIIVRQTAHDERGTQRAIDRYRTAIEEIGLDPDAVIPAGLVDSPSSSARSNI